MLNIHDSLDQAQWNYVTCGMTKIRNGGMIYKITFVAKETQQFTFADSCKIHIDLSVTTRLPKSKMVAMEIKTTESLHLNKKNSGLLSSICHMQL